MNRDTDELLDHDYDGIQEFDNPLPRWWLLTFYGAIVFSVFYFGYYHMGSGPSLVQELAQDIDKVKAMELASKKEVPPPSEAELQAILADAGKKALGGSIYQEKCASCHGKNGEGQIGPNLTDDYWIHGDGTLVSLMPVVSDGVPDKGMPPWGSMLSRDELMQVVAYVNSVQGTKPANPKAPQGNKKL